MHSYYRSPWSTDPVMTEKPVGTTFSHYISTCGSIARAILPAKTSQISSARDPTSIDSNPLSSPLTVGSHFVGLDASAKRHRLPSSPSDSPQPERPATKKAKTAEGTSTPEHLPSSVLSPDSGSDFSLKSRLDGSAPMNHSSTSRSGSSVPALDPDTALQGLCPPSPSPSESNETARYSNPPEQVLAAAESTLATPEATVVESSPSDVHGPASQPFELGRISNQPKPDASPAEPTPLGLSLLEKARQVIGSQFDVEVLLKHQELERINQEMAKCQTALEQLRRCCLVPYPAIHSMDAFSSSFEQSPHGVPNSAAWGTLDGPYSRHYATWLLPDPAFDTLHPGTGPYRTPNSSHVTLEGRSSRLSNVDAVPALPVRAARASAAAKSAVFTSDGASTGCAGRDPLVLRRSTDGKLVRLVCNKCQKDQFANVQGFINHYRIQHHYGFKSHDAAAIACGQVIEDPSVESQSGDSQAVQPSPSSQAPSPSSSTSGQIKASEPSALLASVAVTSRDVPRLNENSAVHPLIRSEGILEVASEVQGLVSRLEPQSNVAEGTYGSCKATSTSSASSDVPHLSLLLQKRGFSGDLSQLVSDSRMKIDLASLSEDEEEESEEPTTHPTATRTIMSRLELSSVPVSDDCPDLISSPTCIGSNSGLMSDSDDEVEDDICSPSKVSPNPRPSVGCGRTISCNGSQDVDVVDIVFPHTSSLDHHRNPVSFSHT